MSLGANENTEEKDAQQETIFGDVLDLSGYEKSISNTRKWLYMVAAIWFIWGIISFNKVYDRQIAYLVFGEYFFVSLAFMAFAVWSRRKPSWAFLTAIIFYVLLNGWLYYSMSINMQSVLLRIVIIISIVKGYFDARKYEELKLTMNMPDEEN